MTRTRLLLGVALAVAALAGYWAYAESACRFELATARREMAAGRHLPARKRLVALSNRFLPSDEVWIDRGDCELALGESDEALASWSKISPGSHLAGEAAVRIGRAWFAKGKLAPAEAKFVEALARPGPQTVEARDRMILLLKFQGRMAEVRALIQQGWMPGGSPVDVLRALWDQDYTIYPIEGVKRFLVDAGRSSPDDDRILLGRANLATRLGDFDDASRRLDECLKRRPDDPVVWRSRLEWAEAADDPDVAATAAARLPADTLTSGERLALRAWFARRKISRKAEVLALEELDAAGLLDAASLERLAELATLRGDPAAASTYRARKQAQEKDLDRYRNGLYADDPTPRAAELARIAESLGRRFDARCWWTVAQAQPPHQAEATAALARLDRDPPDSPKGRTLAEGLAGVLPSKDRPRSTASGRLVIPTFRDLSGSSGLAAFAYDNGRSEARQLPETMGGGLALLDFDGDGRMDVYAVQGGAFPPGPGPSKNRDRLFRNVGDGTFVDATEASGLARLPGGYGHGVGVGDFDNDGHPDLFVTRCRSYALFRNKGDGTFEDATEAAGLAGDRDWPTSSAFADLDNDGDLDLYVCHYLAWNPDEPNPCPQDDPKQRFYCYPRLFRALPDHLFRNDGGRFVDVTEAAGIVDKDGRGLGVVAGDIDGDGRVDLFVANDTTANYYFRNLGGLRFEEIANASGVAANGSGTLQAGMGVAFGDQDGDGRMDLAVTNFYAEGTTLFIQAGKDLFFDHSREVGLSSTSRNLLGFGVAFLDANNDGRLDLVATHGHVNDGRPRLPYAMPSRLWLGDARGKLNDQSDRAGDPWAVPRLGRGLVAGDLDNDGRIDVVILAENEPLAYFHNESDGRAEHFVTLRLEGRGSNRDAVGARVRIVSGGRSQVAQRFGGGSYQSSSDPRLHFGLGSSTKVEALEIAWPDGRTERHADLDADRGYLIRQGDATARPLPHFPD